ncbi:MAG: hypothetical protein CL908_23795 [Deltaproteobacteria bacterium]|nr:hypothetical protein [Deltaproteobacteria bacterium]
MVVLFALLAISSLLFADGAAACSVCYSSSTDTRWAYYGTTALMALVPLAFVVSIALWLRRAARAREAAAGELEGLNRGI